MFDELTSLLNQEIIPEMNPHQAPPFLKSQTQAHLKTLSICSYIYGGLILVGILFLAVHWYFMKFILKMAEQEEAAKMTQTGEPIPEELFMIMDFFYLFFGIVLIGIAVMNFLSAKGLAQQRMRNLIYVTAVVNCFAVPMGTILGIFTFVVISKQGAVQLFDDQKQVS